VHAPALLINGDAAGPLFRSTIPATLHRLLPDSTRVEIGQASHLMHEDNPEAFNEALLAFLARHGG